MEKIPSCTLRFECRAQDHNKPCPVWCTFLESDGSNVITVSMPTTDRDPARSYEASGVTGLITPAEVRKLLDGAHNAGVSQTTLAGAVGVSVATLHRWRTKGAPLPGFVALLAALGRGSLV